MAYDFITPSELQQEITKAVAPLQKRLTLLERIVPRYLPTEAACAFLGVTRKTLGEYRDAPGSLIEYKKEGARAGKYLYCVLSLERHNEAKTIRRPRLSAAA